jgi:hypothetical protein
MRSTSVATLSRWFLMVSQSTKAPWREPFPLADVLPSLVAEASRLQATEQKVADDFVGEELHAAVGVMNDEPLARPEQFGRDDERAKSIVAGPAFGIADDVRVSLAEPGQLGRIDASVRLRRGGGPPRKHFWRFGATMEFGPGQPPRCPRQLGGTDTL